MRLPSRIPVTLWLCLACAMTSFAADESIAALKKKSLKLTTDVMNVEALKQAATVCEQILEKQPEERETLTLLSRVYWSLGNHEKDRGAQSEWFKKGEDAAQKLKEVYSESADGYYWYGVNYGEWVDRASIFAKIGAKGVMMENMNKVLEYNDKYDAGGAYIVIGRINYIAPGGSYAKAIECYEKAIKLGPRRTTAYVYLGELYMHEHIFAKAEDLLKKVLTMEVDPRYAIEQRDDRELAKKLLKKLDKKEEHFPAQEELTGH